MVAASGTITKIFFIDENTGAGIFLVDQEKWTGRVNIRPDIGDTIISHEPLELTRHPKYGPQYRATFLEVDYPIHEKYIRRKLMKIFGRKTYGLAEDANIWGLLRNRAPVIPDRLCQKFAEYEASSARRLIKGLALYLFEKRLEWPRQIIFGVENAIPEIGNMLRVNLTGGLLILANCHEFPADKFALLYDLAAGTESDILIRLKMLETARRYEDDGGHTIMPYNLFYEQCKIRHDIMGVRKFLREYTDFVKIEGDAIARKYIHDMEKYIAKRLAELSAAPAVIADHAPDISGLSASQQAAVKLIFGNKLSLIMGAAGTGKSTVLLRILKAAESIKIHVLAPTGKAVSRIRESTRGGSNIMTIHRWNIMPPHDPDLIFIDEASMLDIPTFYKSLHLIPEKAHICLMGDPYQLPSVGIGCVFFDMLNNNFARLELDLIFRQADESPLMRVIKEVRMGKIPANLADFLIEANTQSEIDAALVRAVDVTALPLIITPLNSTIRRLTPLVRQAPTPEWIVGDRVIQTVNIGQKDRYNGLTGVITKKLPDGGYQVRFCTGEEQTYTRLEAENELALAYVLSVHKAQGSEADDVIIVLPPLNMECRLLTNRLIYTAISRAKKTLQIIGPRAVFRHMVKTNETPRKTLLLSIDN